MDTITLAELQQHPDQFLGRIRAGERLLLVRDGEPVAELRPVEATPPRPSRPRGLCAGQFVVPADFDPPCPRTSCVISRAAEMRLLLDTHIFLWHLTDDPQLPGTLDPLVKAYAVPTLS